MVVLMGSGHYAMASFFSIVALVSIWAGIDNWRNGKQRDVLVFGPVAVLFLLLAATQVSMLFHSNDPMEWIRGNPRLCTVNQIC